MNGLGAVDWPPAPIRTERLVLRASEARDRPAFVELLSSPEVNTYLGGARPRAEVDRELPPVPEGWPGSFVVERDGVMIGQVLLRRAQSTRRPAAVGKIDLGYLFLPTLGDWGMPVRLAGRPSGGPTTLPGEPVVLFTQTANLSFMRLATRLGFIEVERFHAWDAEQWLGLRPPIPPPG